MDISMKWSVSRIELTDHLLERVQHHSKRNGECLKEAEGIDESLEKELETCDTVSDRMALKSTSNYNNAVSRRETLRQSARRHAVKATTFKFLYDHVPNDPTYRLSHSELVELEFIPSGF